MVAAMDFAKVGRIYVCVYLRCADVGVSQKFLYGANVRTVR